MSPLVSVLKLIRDPGNRRVVVAVCLKFVLLAGLWWMFVKDVTWAPSPGDVGNAFLSSARSANDPVQEPAP